MTIDFIRRDKNGSPVPESQIAKDLTSVAKSFWNWCELLRLPKLKNLKIQSPSLSMCIHVQLEIDSRTEGPMLGAQFRLMILEWQSTKTCVDL